MTWKDAKYAPRNSDRVLAVACVFVCGCHQGARTAVAGGRINGEWVLEPSEHHLEPYAYLVLPELPPLPTH